MKQCNECLETKEDTDFYVFKPRGNKKTYLYSKCKECIKAARRTEDAKKTRAKSRSEYDTLTREDVFELKKAPCVDCGKTYHPCVMDYDHVLPGKLQPLARMVGRYSKKAILAEIAKCELVCSNCHRMRTWNRRQL